MTTLTNPTSGWWINADGLPIKFGTNEGATDRGGEYAVDGGVQRVIELKFDFGDFTSNVTVPGPGTGSRLPKGAFIEKVDVLAEIACVGSGSTLNIGLVQTDFSTLVSATALASAFPQTSLATAGQYTSLTEGATYAGSSIGTKLGQTSIVTVQYNTAALSAGKVVVRVYYFMPTPQSISGNQGMTENLRG